MSRPSAPYLRGQRIDPQAVTGKETVADLIDNAFLAYNAGRIREGCQLFTRLMLGPDVTVGMTLTGAMTPAGVGMSCLIPLMESGFVDWVISTGANLYQLTRRQLHRDERRRAGPRREQAALRRKRGCERDRELRAGGQAGGGEERRTDRRRRQPEKLHAPDRAPDPGSARYRRAGPRLLP